LIGLFLTLSSSLSIALVGDSITAGQTCCPPGPSYAELVALEYPDTINAGFGGLTTRDWVRDVLGLPGAFPFPPPVPSSDIVVILLGANDAVGFFEEDPTPPPEYQANMELLIDFFEADGSRVLTVAPSTWPGLSRANRQRLIDCQMICEVLGCLPALEEEFFPTFGNPHPSPAGHAELAERVLAVIPEPSPVLLVGAGLALLGLRRRASRPI
jgi:hypothetical protein